MNINIIAILIKTAALLNFMDVFIPRESKIPINKTLITAHKFRYVPLGDQTVLQNDVVYVNQNYGAAN